MIENEKKVKFVPVHAMKAHMYMGNRGIAPFVLNLGPRGRGVANFTSRPFHPRGGGGDTGRIQYQTGWAPS